MFLLPSPLLLLLLSPLLLSLLLFPSPVLSQTFFTQECGNSVNSVYSTSCVGATGTNAHAAWSPRSNAFVFEYSGAIWIAGGEGSTTTPATTLTIAPLNDVWGSYVRTHTHTAPTLTCPLSPYIPPQSPHRRPRSGRVLTCPLHCPPACLLVCVGSGT